MSKEARQKVLNFLAVLLLVVNLIPTAAVAEVLKEKELILTQFETVKTTDTYTDIDLAFQTHNETSQPFVKTIQLDEGVSVEAVNLQDQSDLADLAGIQLEIAAQPLASGLTEAQQLEPEDAVKLKPQELKVTVAADTKKTVKLRLQVNTAQYTATALTATVDKQTMTTAFENPLASDSSEASSTTTNDLESSTLDTATDSTDSERESNTESDETDVTDESNQESTTSQPASETSEASSTSGDSTETASSGTELTTTTTSEAASETSSTKEISTETSAKAKETTNSSNSTKKNTLRATPQTIESLFNQYAPGDSFVKGVTISPDPITDPNDVSMHVDFGAPEVVQQAMRPGDTFTLPVPNGLDINSTAPIELKQGGNILAIATMDPANNQILVTLTTDSGSTDPADYTPETFTPIASGEMEYFVKVDQQVITHPGKSTIVFPTEYNLPPQTIFINPQTKNSVSKAGTFDKQVNPSNITWKVDVNRTLATLENPTLTETFPPTVSFGSVAIYPEELNMDGTVASVGTTPLVEGEDYEVDAAGNVTFNGTIDQAYQVVYQTPINDKDKPDNGGNVVFKNTAHWNGQDASATLTGKYGARLAKTQNGYSSANQTYKWTIQYNRGFKTIDTTNPIVDTFSNNMEIVNGAAGVQLHYMAANANGSYSQGGLVPTDAYTVTITDGKMAILFNNNVTQNQAIDITYSTKVNPVVDGTNNVTVNNTVSQEGVNNPGQPHVTQPVQQTLIKNTPTLDIGKQIATWTVDVNKNKYQLNNATFTDTVTGSEEGYISFPIYLDSNGNTTPTNDLIQIKDDTGYVLKGAYTANGVPMTGFGVPEDQADYVMDVAFTSETGLPNPPYTDFTIKFINKYQTTSHSFHMTYMTSYNQFSDPKDPNNPKSLAYVNRINMDWTEENGTEHHSTSTNQFTTSTQEANQGIKSGVYNAKTKEITWTVLANYNNAGVPSFSMTDPVIPNTDPKDVVNSQAYVSGSLSILRGTINPSGNFQADGTANYGGEQKEKSYIAYTEPNEDNGETLQIDVGTDAQNIPGWNGNEPPMVYQIQFKTSLKGKVINQNTYSNTATTEVAGVSNDLSASVSVKYGNNLLSKSGSYAPGDGNIHWQLQINQNQSYLIAPVITDLPSTNQMLIDSTIALYPTSVAVDGTIEQGNEPLKRGQDYNTEITTDPATGQQTLTVNFLPGYIEPGASQPDVIERAYMLVYQTKPNFTTQTEAVTNNAKITSQGETVKEPDTTTTTNVTIHSGSGVAFGKKGSVTIQKQTATGQPLAGARLQLIRVFKGNNSSVAPQIIYDVTTSETGQFTFGNLVYTPNDGNGFDYFIKEIAAPDGYTISPELQEGVKVVVDDASTHATTPIIIENEPVTTTFFKEDGNGTKLAGGLFSLMKWNESENDYDVLSTFAAEEAGVKLQLLTVGKYQIRELSAPYDDMGLEYLPNFAPVAFVVREDADGTRKVYGDENSETPISQVVLNNYQGSAVLTKQGEEGEAIQGAVFTLEWAPLNTSDYEPVADRTFVSDENGQVLFDQLRPGKYMVTEQSVNGYYLNGTKLLFTVTGDASSKPEPIVILDNPFINYKGNAVFTKISGETGAPLPGAIFQLLDEKGAPILKNGEPIEVTSDNDGKILVENLAPGTTYGLSEIKAPDDYVINDTILKFTMPLSGTGDSEYMINEPTQKLVYTEDTPFKNYNWKVFWTKQAQDNLSGGDPQPIGGAEFRLYKENASGVFVDITDPANNPENIDYGQTVDGTFMSNPLTGNVSVQNLTGGDYQYKEVTAPTGYILDTTVHEFHLESDAGSATETTIDVTDAANPLINYKGAAQMLKQDEAGNDVDGAVFGVYTAENDAPVEINNQPLQVTSSDGVVYAEGLAPGNYYFKEISTPNNAYLVNTREVPFEIVNEAVGKPEVVHIKNTDGTDFALVNYQGSALLTKWDGEATTADTPLAGATFNVYLSGEETPVNQTPIESDGEGHVLITGLAPGDYYFEEVTAAEGYIRNTTTVPFTIPTEAQDKPIVVGGEQDGTKLNLSNYKGRAQLTKENLGSDLLDGAQFQLLDANDNPIERYGTMTTEEGVITVTGLAPGKYRFKEITPPDGYLLNTAVLPQFEIAETAADEPAMVTIDVAGNDLTAINYKGSAQMQKIEETADGSIAVPGAHFEVLDQDANSVAGFEDLISGPDGMVFADGLAPGTYQFRETQAAPGYVLNANLSEPFTILAEAENAPDTIMVGDFVNFKGTVSFVKTDNHSQPLPGAVFQLWDVADPLNPELVAGYDHLISDSQGIVQATGLAPGVYELRESQAPVGYVLNSNPQPFTIVSAATSQPVINLGEFANFQGTITMKKTDKNKAGLAGAVFQLWNVTDPDNPQQVAEHDAVTTDDEGQLTITDLVPGAYELREVTAPKGYVINSNPIDFTIVDTAATPPMLNLADFVNYQGNAVLKKTDSTGNPLAGAVFQVWQKGNDSGPVAGYENLQSDTAGVINVLDIAPGNYELREITAPSGYVLNTNPIEFTIASASTEEQQLDLGEFVNFRGTVTMKKTDKNGVGLAGAVFQLWNVTNSTVPKAVAGQEAVTTDASGQLTISDLVPGDYELREVTAPEGYVINTNPINFTIVASAAETPVMTLADFINYQGNATLKKTDSTGNPLAGAAFQVWQKGGVEPVAGFEDIQSDSNGLVNVANLAPGNYELREVSAPVGYIVNTNPVPFTIEKESAEEPHLNLGEFANYQGQVTLQKTNQQGHGLAGAVFQLWDVSAGGNGQLLRGAITSGEDGQVVVKDLAPGRYELRETSAPTGYIRNTAAIPFEIEAESKTAPTHDLGTFVNFKGQATLIKTNEKGQPLSGATFELWQVSGDEATRIAEVVSDRNGHLQVANLAPGTYEWRETKAPTGYVRSSQVVRFTIDEAAAKAPALDLGKFENQPTTPYPHTGESSNPLWIMLGLTIIGGALLLLRKRRV